MKFFFIKNKYLLTHATCVESLSLSLSLSCARARACTRAHTHTHKATIWLRSPRTHPLPILMIEHIRVNYIFGPYLLNHISI